MKTRKEFLKWLCQPPKGSVPDGYYHGSLIYKAKTTEDDEQLSNDYNLKYKDSEEDRSH